MRRFALVTAAALGLAFALAGSGAAKPEYEPAYFDGTTVTINAIEVHQNANTLANATADLYDVIYPKVALDAGLVPQCNPCDHGGGPTFHDHMLDSVPSDPGGGEFSPLWHVLIVRPNYTADQAHNAAVNAAYLSQLPLKSEAAVDTFI